MAPAGKGEARRRQQSYVPYELAMNVSAWVEPVGIYV